MRSDEQRLRDVLAAVEAIHAHLERGTLHDGLVFDAVRVRLIEIGEAVKAIDPAVFVAEPLVPWADIAGMRNHLAHRYFDTDHVIVSATVESDLPPLTAAVHRLLGNRDRLTGVTEAASQRDKCRRILVRAPEAGPGGILHWCPSIPSRRPTRGCSQRPNMPTVRRCRHRLTADDRRLLGARCRERAPCARSRRCGTRRDTCRGVRRDTRRAGQTGLCPHGEGRSRGRSRRTRSQLPRPPREAGSRRLAAPPADSGRGMAGPLRSSRSGCPPAREIGADCLQVDPFAAPVESGEALRDPRRRLAVAENLDGHL